MYRETPQRWKIMSVLILLSSLEVLCSVTEIPNRKEQKLVLSGKLIITHDFGDRVASADPNSYGLDLCCRVSKNRIWLRDITVRTNDEWWQDAFLAISCLSFLPYVSTSEVFSFRKITRNSNLYEVIQLFCCTADSSSTCLHLFYVFLDSPNYFLSLVGYGVNSTYSREKPHCDFLRL